MKSPFRWSMFAAGLAVAWASCGHAQDVSPGEPVVESGYEFTEPYANEPESGVRFQADALIWSRTDPSTTNSIIGGPGAFSLNGLSNGYVGGYRLEAAWLIDPNYEAEAVWTSFADWNATQTGYLTRAISFNGGTTSALVDPSLHSNFINRNTFFRPLFDAAMDPLANPAITNYAFLRGGSAYTLYSNSELADIQANFKSRRTLYERLSVGVGYRNIRLEESVTAAITGDFGTNDLPGGGNTFNILTDEALTGHGLTLVSGAADGWTNDPADLTTLAMQWTGTASNQLNGFQGTLDGSLAEWGRLSLEGLLRVGIFYNRMTGQVQEIYAGGGGDNSVYGRKFSDEKDGVSFGSNLGLNAVFAWNDNLRLRTGYELMFLTNVALSGQQQDGLAYNNLGVASYSVQDGSSVVFHGLRLGVELVW